MERTAVNSSNIKSVGHNGKDTLEIEFWGKGNSQGPVWQYTPVMPEVYAQLMSAPSVGSYFSTKIKSNPNIQDKRLS